MCIYIYYIYILESEVTLSIGYSSDANTKSIGWFGIFPLAAMSKQIHNQHHFN